MNWMPQIARSHTFSQLERTSHITEFVPRMSGYSTSPSSSFSHSSFVSVSPSAFNSLAKKFEEQELSGGESTPVNHSPAHSSSPILQEKLNVSNGPVVVPAYHENVGGTTYFFQQYPQDSNGESSEGVQPIVGSSNEYVPFVAKSEMSYFVADDIKQDVMNRSMLSLLQGNSTLNSDLPQEVESYHELYPLEPISNQVLHKAHLGYQTSMYKATHAKTGVRYCLRRIHGFRLQNAKFMTMVETWKKLNHPNIVQLKEVFTTKAFGDNSMVFVYSYYPGSETLMNKFFSNDQPGYLDPFASDKSTPMPYSYQKNNLLRHQQINKLSEALIWNYVMQLASALRSIHSSGLACRSLDPTKIILTSKNRLRLSCLAVMDVVIHEGTSVNHVALVQHYQQQDLTSLGKLVLALACKSTMAVQRDNMPIALEMVQRSYSPDLHHLISTLLSNSRKSVTDLMPTIGARFFSQLDNLHGHIDALDGELAKEVQNDRLFKLMAKLTTINERPEFNMESTWSETGDRYMLKLFRDYVFHQVTEEGQPWIDMGHIIQCLNKLDAGAPEKICLMSRDEQSVLVVTYAELKHCFEQSFQELCANGAPLHLHHELDDNSKV
ncbi:PAN2-PAN3 deadenylation complex subunit pan3 isoform X2 [Anthonomus grandis grandis]|uniref:PAN2-PAN3 deadenylation complex subunit pan3 isoform X2 n=1 Tax=Anthonomus grandis grandis TaxID=2921223 RepID=UPI0021657A02|nr:PAN2-PAN3 deadenylation complex subunit pan3 isoform X2 [Anthonomus grandis grandis]